MTDLEKAMAEFLAKSAPTICPPVVNAKTAIELAKQTRATAKAKEEALDAAERAERNAENIRYDAEGVFYIGGKL